MSKRKASPTIKETRPLADFFVLRRRYTRSINLERDRAITESLDGYIPTPRAMEVLGRVAAAQVTEGLSRSWTITGVYGTGKSACAHFLASLCGAAEDPMRKRALAILRSEALGASLANDFRRNVPESGYVRAIATSRRETLAATVLRALCNGADHYWANRRGRPPAVLEGLRKAQTLRPEQLGRINVAELVADTARAAHSGVILILDELGKTLEFAAEVGSAADLHLLQELAELSADRRNPTTLVLGLLHQAYSEYGYGLTKIARGEWDKIQGRFEDIPFSESSDQTLRLITRVIEPAEKNPLKLAIGRRSHDWADYLRESQHSYIADALPAERVASLFPLHPVAALVLPLLCAKYAQNDRSLFTFLTGNESYSLARYLDQTPTPLAGVDVHLPLLKLPRVYDYFVDAAGAALVARPQFQRWAEVHSLIREAIGLPEDELEALKVVGTLNLVGSSGPVRASRALCVAALVERPREPVDARRVESALDRLCAKRLITYRQQADEYRIWEGSDFDIDEAVHSIATAERRSLADILALLAPLSPIVAQRHSYQTGTLRYFERRYVERSEDLAEVRLVSSESDGVVVYWTNDIAPISPPSLTVDGRPLVLLPIASAPRLRATAIDYAALVSLERGATALQSDGVARREVRQRLALARSMLDDALHAAFDVREGRTVWAAGEYRPGGNLGSLLSDICDRTYERGARLWNELINRRELTSQGARARRELIEALLDHATKPRLGLTGDGPEVSMYASVLKDTGIHREGQRADHLDSDGHQVRSWTVGSPTRDNVSAVWDAIESFCLEATTEARSIDRLYAVLEAPPFGTKRGIIPVLLAALLVYHADDVSVYRDGTFLPTLGAEQFELLVKQPDRFSVKHFALTGLRLELFRELESVLRRQDARIPAGLRNSTVLGVVRPLVRFATSLPGVTRKTKALPSEAIAVRDALLSSVEPDTLLFDALPRACGFEPFPPVGVSAEASDDLSADDRRAEGFRQGLFRALRDLQNHYNQLLDQCRSQIHSAFGVRSDILQLREDLRVRAQYLVGQVLDPKLRSFIHAAATSDTPDRDWIESLAMILADRPLENWTDEELAVFEVHVSDVARRFANLEALQKEAAREGHEGFDARRITVTSADGSEVHRLVWIDRDERAFVGQKVGELLTAVRGLSTEHQRQAVAMALVEEFLSSERAGSGAIELGTAGSTRPKNVSRKHARPLRHG